MQNLEEIAERIHQSLSERTTARDRALTQSRALTRRCAHAIRAAHRNERAESLALLAEARTLAQNFQTELKDHPDLYFAGYTQDALKEYAEASIVYALLGQEALPTPEELGLEPATYLQGLAEAAGEFRRGCLDLLRTGQAQEAERLLGYMDDIYGVLVTMDYPDAITGGLRRLTDIVRGVTERTRGDLTLSLRQEQLERRMTQLSERLDQTGA